MKQENHELRAFKRSVDSLHNGGGGGVGAHEQELPSFMKAASFSHEEALKIL